METILYECCDVLACARLDSLCWACGLKRGISYYDAYGDANPAEQPYRVSQSTIYMMMSQVKEEFLSCPHP